MARPTRAVVTMAHNEALFLPIWWHYYSRFFAQDDIYILDHESSDGSTSGGGFVRIPVHRPVVDWGWHRDMLQEQQHRLKRRYDVVLCTDADEIVAPDPQFGTLGDYIDRFEDEFVNCTGYELIHMRDLEPAFDRSRPVLQQRGWWFRNPVYSKPLLARVPMEWHGGLHQRTDGRVNDDPALFLIHLHRMDFALCHERHRQRMARPWNQRDVDENWGYQNRIVEDEAFATWFYTDSCAGVPVEVERVPERFRGLF